MVEVRAKTALSVRSVRAGSDLEMIVAHLLLEQDMEIVRKDPAAMGTGRKAVAMTDRKVVMAVVRKVAVAMADVHKAEAGMVADHRVVAMVADHKVAVAMVAVRKVVVAMVVDRKVAVVTVAVRKAVVAMADARRVVAMVVTRKVVADSVETVHNVSHASNVHRSNDHNASCRERPSSRHSSRISSHRAHCHWMPSKRVVSPSTTPCVCCPTDICDLTATYSR